MALHEDILLHVFQNLQPSHLYPFILSCRHVNAAFKKYEETYCAHLRVIQLFQSAIEFNNQVKIMFVGIDTPKVTWEISIFGEYSAIAARKRIWNMIHEYKHVNCTAFVQPSPQNFGFYGFAKHVRLFSTQANIQYYDAWFKKRGLDRYGILADPWPCYISCAAHSYRICNRCPMSRRFHNHMLK